MNSKETKHAKKRSRQQIGDDEENYEYIEINNDDKSENEV